MVPKRQWQLFTIEGDLLCRLLTAAGVLNGLPADAQVVRVHENWEMNGVSFAIESAQFPELVPGVMVPHLVYSVDPASNQVHIAP